MQSKKDRLEAGETFITSEKGNSMVPLIKSGQEHELSPCKIENVKKGDIVYCRVNGKFYTHLVKAVGSVNGDTVVLIGNNRGRNNGWTGKVYGKVTRIL